jgi:hypothetical protein
MISAVKAKGKDTGPETKTEQEYIPLAVQIKRMINAGENLLLAKKEMYDIGWDEEYNLNKVRPHAINLNLDRIDAQEILENAAKNIQELKRAQNENVRGPIKDSEADPEGTTETDDPVSDKPGTGSSGE